MLVCVGNNYIVSHGYIPVASASVKTKDWTITTIQKEKDLCQSFCIKHRDCVRNIRSIKTMMAATERYASCFKQQVM